MRTFLESVTGTRDYPLYLLFAATGTRRGQLLGLSWDATDLDAGSITIGQTLVMASNAPTLKSDPKTDASAAMVGIDDDTVEVLRAHRKRQLEERMKAGELWNDSGLVFTDELGNPLNPNTVTRRFQRAAKAAKLPPCRLHSLRHAYASMLLDAGVPLEAIKGRLRHSDISTTSNLYAHFSKKLDRQVAEIGAAHLMGGGS